MNETDALHEVASSYGPYTVEDLAADLEVSYSWLQATAKKIDKVGYRSFVPAGRKKRVISNPYGWLKALQERVKSKVLSRLVAHNAVFSQRGRNQVQNAKQHVGRPYLLVMDVRNCYPNITVERVRAALRRAGFQAHVADLIARLVTYRNFLPQGACTSGAILDCVFRGVDEALTAIAAEHDAIYTRFGDDLAFSSHSPMYGLDRKVKHTLGRHGFTIGHKKTKRAGPGELKVITNIEVSDCLHAPAGYRRDVTQRIRRFARRNEGSESSITGMIGWIAQLNSDDGAVFKAQLRRAVKQRAS